MISTGRDDLLLPVVPFGNGDAKPIEDGATYIAH